MGPSARQVGWLGRTFGVSNGPGEWLTRLGAVAWLVGLLVVFDRASRLPTGEAVLVVGAWFLLLAVVARSAVRDMFGPVFFYEVVRVGRRKMTFRLRFLYTGIICGMLLLMYLAWLEELHRGGRQRGVADTGELSKFANAFFEMFVVVQYATVMLLTPVYVAGAVAVEKERKTLEFLLATDLRNREIVFGKLAARVANILMFVFAGLPIIAVLQLFGGIDPNLLLASFAATVINVIGLAAVAVFMSVMMRRARDAIVLTYMLAAVYVFASLFMAALAIAPPFAGAWWTYPVTAFGYSFRLADAMFAAADGNPLWVVIRLQPGPGGPPGFRAGLDSIFKDFATFWGVVTVLFIAVAVWRLRAVALAQSYGPVRAAKKGAKGKSPRRYPEVGENPVLWREVFVESGSRGGWLGKVIAATTVLVMFVPAGIITYSEFFAPNPWQGNMSFAEHWHEFTREMNGWARVVTGILTVLVLFAVALRGAGAVSGEKDKDTWISLVGTPLAADRILWGKWWGCVLGPRRAYFVMILVLGIGLSVGAVHPLSLFLAVPMLIVVVSALAWVGLFCSMRASNGLNASIQTFFVTLFLAGGFWIVLLAAVESLDGLFNWTRDISRDLYQVGMGFTPPFMTGGPLFQNGDRYDMQPFDFEMTHGLGFYALPFGLAAWVVLNILFASACLWKFRRLTNRVPVYLPEEMRMRAEYNRRAAVKAS